MVYPVKHGPSGKSDDGLVLPAEVSSCWCERAVARRSLVAILLLGLSIVAGCDGCRSSRDPLSDDKDAPERLEDFESGELTVLPTDGALAAYGVKPGPWYSARQQLKSNKDDFDGDLQGETTDPGRAPYLLANSPFQLRSRRPASLPKGQTKTFELT